MTPSMGTASTRGQKPYKHEESKEVAHDKVITSGKQLIEISSVLLGSVAVACNIDATLVAHAHIWVLCQSGSN